MALPQLDPTKTSSTGVPPLAGLLQSFGANLMPATSPVSNAPGVTSGGPDPTGTAAPATAPTPGANPIAGFLQKLESGNLANQGILKALLSPAAGTAAAGSIAPAAPTQAVGAPQTGGFEKLMQSNPQVAPIFQQLHAWRENFLKQFPQLAPFFKVWPF